MELWKLEAMVMTALPLFFLKLHFGLTAKREE